MIKEFTNNIIEHFESGLIKPILDSEFTLDQVSEAHARVESNETIGKVLMKVYLDDSKTEF